MFALFVLHNLVLLATLFGYSWWLYYTPPTYCFVLSFPPKVCLSLSSCTHCLVVQARWRCRVALTRKHVSIIAVIALRRAYTLVGYIIRAKKGNMPRTVSSKRKVNLRTITRGKHLKGLNVLMILLILQKDFALSAIQPLLTAW